MVDPQLAYGAAFCIFFFFFGKKAYVLIMEILRNHRGDIVQHFDHNTMLLQKARGDYEKLLNEEEKMSEILDSMYHSHQENMASLANTHREELKKNKDFYERKKEQQEKIMEHNYRRKILNYQWSLLEERLKHNAHCHKEESMMILLQGTQKAMSNKMSSS